jgi:outer membrane protein OmpA-like peptidoglycan-associated protein
MRKLLQILYFLLLPVFVSGQFSFLDDPYSDIQLEFLREKIEAQPEKSFFNVLQIVNPTNRRLQFKANFSLPKGWTLMVEKSKLVTLNPNDTILIPIRGALARDVKGEIGYAVVASLLDNKGQSFKNIYSFVNVPKVSFIRFRPSQRTYYFNNTTNSAEIQLNFLNKGNIDEVVYLEFSYDKGIKVQNGEPEMYKTEFLLATNSDTTLSYSLVYTGEKNIVDKRNFRVHIKAFTKDTALTTAIWLKKINQQYLNYIPDRNRMLILQLTALNLFSEYDPTYTGYIKGSILTKKLGNLFYRFQSMGSNFLDDPYRYSRMEMHYDYKNFRLHLGDIGSNIEQSLFGRGFEVEYDINKHSLLATATQNIFTKANQAGARIKLQPSKSLNIEAGGVYAEDNTTGKSNYLGMLGAGTSFLNKYSVYFRGGISQQSFTKYKEYSHIGFGGYGSFQARFDKINFKTRLHFGDRKYTGYFAGRMNSYSNISYNYSNRLNFYLHNSIFRNSPPTYFQDSLLDPKYYNNTRTQLQSNYFINSTIRVFGGLIYNTRKANNFYNFNPDYEFSAPTTSAFIGLKLRSRQSPLSLNLKGQFGYTINNFNPDAVEFKSSGDGKNYTNLILSANLESKIWRVYISYFHGPYSMTQHYSYVYNQYQPRSVRILPQISFFLYKDLIEVTNRTSLMRDISASSTRINVGTDINIYPGKGWKATFLNTIGYQSTLDDVTEEKYKYNSTYFELRIQKKFGFNQPRFQYHDISIVYFKDLNGDGIKTEDEPGIQNVLTKVDHDHSITDTLSSFSNEGGFYAVELLSDIKGLVHYHNLPGGYYEINYVSLGTMQGNFSSDKTSISAYIDKDQTIYIPFKENNKIYGSVIMNRSKLSSLGTITPSNIKVTAKDSKGNVYSTLTDRKGDFVIYVPDVDSYIITINNIYYEHFNLEQNNFEVQLNGYRQFEINFILNEKRRRINFSNELEIDPGNEAVRVIRRTNLSGSVKDAATLKPLKSEIQVINEETGGIVTSARSDSKNGKFYLTFLAGPMYKMVITADGYWYYSESIPSSQITTFQNVQREVLLDYITVGSKVDLKAIVFESESANLTPESMAELDRLAALLLENPNIELEIVGHCDDLEALDNAQIAADRAKMVMKYLIEKGVGNLQFTSAGNSQPIARENTDEARQKNRRVEAVVISK